MPEIYARVLIPQGAFGDQRAAPLYPYAAPDSLTDALAQGQAALVPFGSRLVVGIVWEVGIIPDLPRDQIRAIQDILDPVPLLDAAHRQLVAWLAATYVCSLVDAVRLILPGMTGAPRIDLVPAAVTADSAPLEAAADDAETRALLGLLRAGGHADEKVIRQALGSRRAGRLIAALEARGALTRTPHATRATSAQPYVRLIADPPAIAAWRADILTRLSLPPASLAAPRPATSASRPRRGRGQLLQRIATAGQTASLAPPLATREAARQRAALAIVDLLAAQPATPLPLREVLRVAHATPAALRLAQEASLVTEVAPPDDGANATDLLAEAPLQLTPAQQIAVDQIVATLDAATEILTSADAGNPAEDASDQATRPLLLHGVTGSGKTEVYLQALAQAIARGRRGIALVPEIALTPQTVSRFAARFPGRVALLHSALRPAERQREWRRIRSGAVDVVIGSRSAIFAPIPDLGLIILDEEHDSSYKQDARAPTYHAREVAAALARLTGAAVVLGSATPSAESYYRAQTGAYALVELTERPHPQPLPILTDGEGSMTEFYSVSTLPLATSKDERSEGAMPGSPLHAQHGEGLGDGPLTRSVADDSLRCGQSPPQQAVVGLPPVSIVDLREELHAGHASILSRVLLERLTATLARGEQAILYLNRRGAATCVLCRDCGYVARCGRCDVPLTHHQREAALICHYCNWREAPPRICLQCGGDGIRYFGIGTERVEATIRDLFPHARVLRWDADTAPGYQDHERFGQALARKEVDILIGTQMIAKGLDVPDVTLVGVIAADVALFLPDYRAAERAFQLLTQVAGRAGRGQRPGAVIMQTFSPEHFVIETASRHDYRAFYDVEIAARRGYGYPPFRRFIKLTYTHKDRHACQVGAIALGDQLANLIADLALPDTDIVGPAPAFIERLRDRYRWQMILRGPDPRALIAALAPDDLGPGWTVDIDPISSL